MTKTHWKGAWMALWITGAAGCLTSSSTGPSVDSETHFLRECSQSCPGDLKCICGVCSVTCDPASSCSDTHPEASCVSSAEFTPAEECTTDTKPSVCDVTCEDDVDCASLSADHRCLDGQCRAKAAPKPAGTCEYGGDTYELGDRFDAADGCNTCVCEEDGSVSCTEIGCMPGETCDYDGDTYRVGDTFEATDGCNTCMCEEGGRVACTLRGCPPDGTCEYDGVTYRAGERFDSLDGCNTCTCGADGQIACTEEGCDTCTLPFEPGPCEAAIPVYWHNPDTGACEQRTYGGCEGNDNRFETLDDCAATCGHTTGTGDGISCMVEGEIYTDGEQVPDPFSCNTCVCSDGMLELCSEAGCPEPCPPNSVEGTWCAQCGVVGGCPVMETGCFPVCESDDDCADPWPFCNVLEGHCTRVPACL